MSTRVAVFSDRGSSGVSSHLRRASDELTELLGRYNQPFEPSVKHIIIMREPALGRGKAGPFTERRWRKRPSLQVCWAAASATQSVSSAARPHAASASAAFPSQNSAPMMLSSSNAASTPSVALSAPPAWTPPSLPALPAPFPPRSPPLLSAPAPSPSTSIRLRSTSPSSLPSAMAKQRCASSTGCMRGSPYLQARPGPSWNRRISSGDHHTGSRGGLEGV
eukprot:1182512-Prorocentrum_minimum.AAC.5